MHPKHFNPSYSIIKMKKIIITFLTLLSVVPVLNSRTRVYTTDEIGLEERMSAYLAMVMLKEDYQDLLLQLLSDTSQNKQLEKGNRYTDGFMPSVKLNKNRLIFRIKLTPNNDIWHDSYSCDAPPSFSKKDLDSILKDLRKEILKMDPVICLASPELLRIKKEKRKTSKIPEAIYPYSSFHFQKAVRESGAKTDKDKIAFLKEWIERIMSQQIIVNADPWEALK